MAGVLAFKKYGNWKIGLNKEKDKRIRDYAKKISKTWSRKRKKRLKDIEKEYGKSLRDLINYFYWERDFSQEEISKKLKIPRLWVVNFMKEFDISKKPNFRVIANLKGKKHSKYGKTWEDIYGKEGAKKFKKEFGLKMRKHIVRRLANKEMPFMNTKIEKEFAKELSKREINFISQYPIDNKFVCDFSIPKYKIIIECDGDYWHGNPKIYNKKDLNQTQKRKIKIDRIKDIYLKKKGWKVLRFFETEINNSVSKCVNKIESYFKRADKES